MNFSLNNMAKIILILMSLCLISCGNKKPNKLPDGVVDKSNFPFPPDGQYEYPCVSDESSILCELDGLIQERNEENLLNDE